MSNKTPYELRLDILTLAKEYLDKKQAVDNDANLAAFTQALKDDKITTIEDWYDTYAPVQYSVDDLLDEARRLYDFVLTK